MAIINATYPRFQVIDANGNPLVGGKVYVYEAGTTTALDNWTDAVKTSPNTQPVILDSTGSADIWYEQSAKIDVKTEDDVQVEGFPVDNLSASITPTVTGDFNLIQNGSFEVDTNGDGVPDNWTVAEETNAVISVDSTLGNQTHGTQSLHFDASGGTTGGGTATTSAMSPITASESVIVQWDFKQADAATGTYQVDIEWYKADGNASTVQAETSVWSITTGAPTSFTSYEVIATAPSDATQFKLRLTGLENGGTDETGECWFDNVAVIEYVYGGIVEHPDSPIATTSGTTVTYDNLPPWIKRVTLLFKQVSNDGTQIVAQIGDSTGGLDTTNTYEYSYAYIGTASTAIDFTNNTPTSSWIILNNAAMDASSEITGRLIFDRISDTEWICTTHLAEDVTGTVHVFTGSGHKTLSTGPLDRIVLTSSGTLDGGKITAYYEG